MNEARRIQHSLSPMEAALAGLDGKVAINTNAIFHWRVRHGGLRAKIRSAWNLDAGDTKIHILVERGQGGQDPPSVSQLNAETADTQELLQLRDSRHPIHCEQS